ncbi:PDDEXK nuclease domain-containing protein [Planomonospora venezuelensis]|uniref:Putative nuclease of restriction endonuclease-like (RecB) superfamily n=1 Tax=Planomonospora venezuelensis TaxID=1999 RepID=A0A841DB00_PLAVE|nr:PDDEXK nuclease domain-containing protein [Planomonospora venezuelensis]MBB5964536.1 putative nuclease of restriction endonuclease-like (RecB) superfamily [Planomonospora venezuelensis]GIN02833.1 hypothetical protein Pve01_44910 [Planomonospora venezuelensis]
MNDHRNGKEVHPDEYAALPADTKREIKGQLHLRTGHPLHNVDRTVPPQDRESVKKLIKDPYVLEFLDDNARHERDVEQQIVANVVRFLQELGTGEEDVPDEPIGPGINAWAAPPREFEEDRN